MCSRQQVSDGQMLVIQSFSKLAKRNFSPSAVLGASKQYIVVKYNHLQQTL